LNPIFISNLVHPTIENSFATAFEMAGLTIYCRKERPIFYIVYDASIHAIDFLPGWRQDCIYTQYEFVEFMNDAADVLEQDEFYRNNPIPRLSVDEADDKIKLNMLIESVSAIGPFDTMEDALQNIDPNMAYTFTLSPIVSSNNDISFNEETKEPPSPLQMPTISPNTQTDEEFLTNISKTLDILESKINEVLN
jgi:hypothetical protein